MNDYLALAVRVVGDLAFAVWLTARTVRSLRHWLILWRETWRQA